MLWAAAGESLVKKPHGDARPSKHWTRRQAQAQGQIPARQFAPRSRQLCHAFTQYDVAILRTQSLAF